MKCELVRPMMVLGLKVLRFFHSGATHLPKKLESRTPNFAHHQIPSSVASCDPIFSSPPATESRIHRYQYATECSPALVAGDW